MSQEICKCSLSDDTCPDCLAQDNEALRINNSVLLDHQNELMQKIGRLEKALREIGDFDCECFEDDSCAVCLARLALEGK